MLNFALSVMTFAYSGLLGLPPSWKSLALPYQLCLGTAVAFATCLLGNRGKTET